MGYDEMSVWQRLSWLPSWWQNALEAQEAPKGTNKMTTEQKLKVAELLCYFCDLEIAAQKGEALPFAVSDVGWISQIVAMLRNMLLAN